MLSYNHNSQAFVIAVRDLLNSQGIPTWFDLDNMKTDDILDSMAEGVDGASEIIIFYSEAYKKSPNCRAEAEYAHKRKKQMLFVRVQEKYDPDGWLGILLGTKLYFDFCKGNPEENHNKLLLEVKKRLQEVGERPSAKAFPLKDSAQLAEKEASQKDGAKTLKASAESKSEGEVTVNEWTVDEVQNWLVKEKLDYLQKQYFLYFHKWTTQGFREKRKNC